MRVKMGVENRQVLVATSRADTSMPSGARDRRVPIVRAGPVYPTMVPGAERLILHTNYEVMLVSSCCVARCHALVIPTSLQIRVEYGVLAV